MINKKGNSTIVIILFILILIFAMATYFMFFQNNEMNKTNQNENIEIKPNNEVEIYKNNSEIIEDDIVIEDKNANEIYKRINKGIKYNDKYIEVPKDYMKRFVDKISKKGYMLKDESKEYINKKLNEVEKNINDSKVEDINDLNDETKSKIKDIMLDIENSL